MTALIPKPLLRAPATLLTVVEVQAIQAAFKEHPFVENLKTPFFDCLGSLSDPQEAPKAKEGFVQSAEQFRHQLLGNTVMNPNNRLELHQFVMAANFYGNAVGVGFNRSMGDPRMKILDTYNFDMRRDSVLRREVTKCIINPEKASNTPESDILVGDLLQLERRLFGKSRLAQLESGRQALFLGCPVSEIRDDAHLDALLSLPPIKEHGNFIKTFDDADPDLKDAHRIRWKEAVIDCGEEEGGSEKIDPAPFNNYKQAGNLEWRLRVLKPAPIVPFWGRVRQKALEIWVIFFSAWCIFFMVDEEIISIAVLLYLKYAQTKAIREEKERVGDESRLYMYRVAGHWGNRWCWP